MYEPTRIEAIHRTKDRGTILKGLRVYKPILTINKEKTMFEMDYEELPFVHKLVIMMTHSFNELMRSIYGTHFCPYVKICIIKVSSDDSCLHFYSLNNGIEVGDRKVTIDNINTLDESDILRRINRELAFQEANNNYEEDQRHPMQNACFLANEGGNRCYFVPLAGSNNWYEGTFFHRASLEFGKEWGKAIGQNAALLNCDLEFDKAAERVVHINKLLSSVCNTLITKDREYTPLKKFDYCSFFNQIAALRYEHNKCKGTLVFFDGRNTIPEEAFLVRFIDPICIYKATARSVRKLLELTDDTYGLIVDTKENEILGMTKINKDSSYASFGDDTWKYSKESHDLFKAISGKYMLAQTFEGVMKPAKDISAQWITSEEKMKAIIRMAIKQHRGTGLVFSTVARKEAERLASCNRCILVDGIDLWSDEKLFLLLSSIDGALLLSPDGICYGIGAILDGQATIKGTMERGARYNSMFNYIAWKKDKDPGNKYYVVVVSEDGTLDTIETDEIDLNSKRPDPSNG